MLPVLRTYSVQGTRMGLSQAPLPITSLWLGTARAGLYRWQSPGSLYLSKDYSH